MAVSVQEVIDGARMTQESFTPDLHPNAVALAFLSRYHRTLTQKVVRLNPMLLATVHTILKATWEGGWDNGDTGEAANDHHVYLPGVAYWETTPGWDVCHVADWQTRAREFRQINDANWPAYSIVGGNIFFHGTMTDWQRYASVALYYVPMASDLTLSGNIALPDSAEPALVAGLAYHLAQRTSIPGPNPGLLREDWGMAEQAFLDEVAGYSTPHASTTLDLW